MIKILKSNKFIVSLLFIICIFFIIKPEICANSCLNAVSIWGLKVFPMLFPFFVITRLILNLSTFKPTVMDKFFKKAYNAPNGSFFIFILSVLCGYPMGAKLIGTMHENKIIHSDQAKSMLAFCSVSGPMFMIGTVGVGIFKSYKAGLIILISNVLASLLNGFTYRCDKHLNTQDIEYTPQKKENILSDCIYDSLISILIVGAYIALSSIIIDALKYLQLFNIISNSICKIFNCYNISPLFESVFSSIFEVTNGILDLNSCNVNLCVKTIVSSFLIGFGGLSVILQSYGFLKGTNIKFKTLIIQKLTQGFICLLISTPLCIIFL